MKDYVIVVDGCSCMIKEDREKYGIRILSSPYFIEGDDKKYVASPDYDTISAKEFYEVVRSGKRITTSMINQKDFENLFEEIIKSGKGVLYTGSALKLTASVNQALLAKKELESKYPNAKIECIDTKSAGYAVGMLAMDACKRRDDGMSLEDNVNEIKNHLMNYNEIGYVDKLVYLKRAGRVSAPSAFFGGLLGIKPIIVSDLEGGNNAFEKIKGKQKSFDRMVEILQKYMDTSNHKTVYMMHADCLDEAQGFAQAIQKGFNDKDLKIEFRNIEPAIGASVGPGTLIFNFYASEDLRKDFLK